MPRTSRFVAAIALFTVACLPALAADPAAAAASPQARVYEAHLKAMNAADYQAFRATMSKTAPMTARRLIPCAPRRGRTARSAETPARR